MPNSANPPAAEMILRKCDVVRQADACGADRIRFKGGEIDKLFLAPFDSFICYDEISESALVHGRVLFQKRVGRSYKNIGNWEKVFDFKPFEKEFLTGYKKNKAEKDLLRAISLLELKEFSSVMKKFCYNVVQELPKNKRITWLRNANSGIVGLLDVVDEGCAKRQLCLYAFAYLSSYEIILEEFLFDQLDEFYYLRAVQRIQERIQSSSGKDADFVAYKTVLGQLLSLSDREAASACFSEALSADETGIIALMYMDMGVHTFFSRDELASDADKKISRLREVSSLNLSGSDRSKNTFLISADERFFRIYGAQLAFFAQHSHEIDYNILLVSNDDIAAEVSDFNEYVAALSKLNRCPPPKNFHISRVGIPEFVGNRRTYFACARLLFAADFLKLYDRVYIIDADMLYDDEPAGFVNSLKGPISLVQSKDLIKIAPWRRTMGGNVMLSNDSDSVHEFAHNLARYVVTGLSLQNSWMLDQNALSFAAEEVSEDCIEDLSIYRRPFRQPKFRTRWEANYRKNEK